jgi:hypothetical protein
MVEKQRDFAKATTPEVFNKLVSLRHDNSPWKKNNITPEPFSIQNLIGE